MSSTRTEVMADTVRQFRELVVAATDAGHTASTRNAMTMEQLDELDAFVADLRHASEQATAVETALRGMATQV